MRFSIERDTLTEAVAWVARSLPTRPVLPILSGMLLTADAGELTLACFDYEISARIRVVAQVTEPGTALVPGRLLAEITRSLPDFTVQVDDAADVTLTCGAASFTLVTLPLGDYPQLPDLPVLAGTVDGAALAAAIGQVVPAASRDDTLPILTGVNIELNGGTMTLAATDRYRLAMRELAWEPTEPDVTGTILTPAKTLADAARMMSHGTPVQVLLRHQAGAAEHAADAMIGFESGGRRLTTRLIAGEFIKYKSRFPAEFGCYGDMPAAPLAEAVKRVALVAERGTPVRLSFTAGTVTIEAGTEGQARACETVAAEFEGDEPAIAFSPHYLLDGLGAALTAAASPDAEEARIRLQFSGPTKPAVITGSLRKKTAATPDFRYLVVPLRALGLRLIRGSARLAGHVGHHQQPRRDREQQQHEHHETSGVRRLSRCRSVSGPVHSQPRQVGYQCVDLPLSFGGERAVDAFGQLVQRQPSRREVLAQCRDRGVALGIPDPQVISGPAEISPAWQMLLRLERLHRAGTDVISHGHPVPGSAGPIYHLSHDRSCPAISERCICPERQLVPLKTSDGRSGHPGRDHDGGRTAGARTPARRAPAR
jgi:DNA polymerase-3 subunit beta